MKLLPLLAILLASPAHADDGGVVGAVAGAIAAAMDTGGDDD